MGQGIAINLTGQFYCVKYELQQFLKQGGGVIVNMSSLGGLKAEHMVWCLIPAPDMA
ncbi:SDR family NAD(P)-dependent oxidoreductase [Dyadobacter sp. 3J3]|uniref:SDR family NAD(P)-dependent oxidoreductase n=1 Tax=Dyadobacter sp. 3J3 TaxID=2606600 RepID=UPI001359C733|nr:SDR family NAD(P)-dependent oxidoreductase [Dyadobacter sp. 3J3]